MTSRFTFEPCSCMKRPCEIKFSIKSYGEKTCHRDLYTPITKFLLIGEVVLDQQNLVNLLILQIHHPSR